MVSGSVSLSKSNTDSTYASVIEQSGIKAGDGGFDVKVKGNTDLKGGAIASTDKASNAGRNSLTTGTLTSGNLQNIAQASASSSGINLSSDMLSQGKYSVAKAVIGTGLTNSRTSGNSSGQTKSAVSAAAVAITDEAAQQTKTDKTAAQTIASLNRDTQAAHTAAQEQDVGAMQRTVEAERVIKQEAVRQATLITDSVYRSATGPKKIMLEKCDSQGRNCSAVEVDMKNHQIMTGPDGKVYVFNHGIMNTEQAALANAAKQNTPEALQQGVYVVINPHTGTVIGEVVYAAWDKMLAPAFGISKAAEANIDLVNAARSQGATIDITNHSRGGITAQNFTGQMRQDGVTNAPITTMQLNGSAGNAQDVQRNLNQITSGQGQVNQSTHQNDLVGRIIGGNPSTGGLPSSFGDAHTTYGPNVDPDLANKVWGSGLTSPSLPANPGRK
jgi:filamentous hemagglutinin